MISNKGTIAADIAGLDIEDDISDSDESRAEQGAQIPSRTEMPNGNLSICEIDDRDSENLVCWKIHT